MTTRWRNIITKGTQGGVEMYFYRDGVEILPKYCTIEQICLLKIPAYFPHLPLFVIPFLCNDITHYSQRLF